MGREGVARGDQQITTGVEHRAAANGHGAATVEGVLGAGTAAAEHSGVHRVGMHAIAPRVSRIDRETVGRQITARANADAGFTVRVSLRQRSVTRDQAATTGDTFRFVEVICLRGKDHITHDHTRAGLHATAEDNVGMGVGHCGSKGRTDRHTTDRHAKGVGVLVGGAIGSNLSPPAWQPQVAASLGDHRRFVLRHGHAAVGREVQTTGAGNRVGTYVGVFRVVANRR